MFKTKRFRRLEEENQLLKEYINGISISPTRLLNQVRQLVEEQEFDTIKNLIRTLTDYLTLKEASHCLLFKETHLMYKNDELIDFIFRICHNSETKYQNKECELFYPIGSLNLILNTWNNDRIISNLKGINSKNILKPCQNIRNYYIYPLDIVICCGGNHSQFSAKLKNQGNTQIVNIVDISNLYSVLEFEGTRFTNNNGANNESFKICEDEEEIILGTLYEIGRLLIQEKYRDLYFDPCILKVIS